MQYLALCCIVKNEGAYLREWVQYHSLIGVEHFFIYDNGSTPSARESLGELAARPHVTLLNAPTRSMQLPAYNHCLTEFGNNFKWIGFIDADEFICPAAVSDLRPLLGEYEPYAALALSWRMFSSNGHETRPAGLVLDNYTRYIKQDAVHIKSIVQPRKTAGCRNPHAFGYLDGTHCVNETFSPVPSGAPFWTSSHDRVWLNHYYYKSREDFTAKLTRGRNSVHQENQPWWSIELFDKHLSLPSFPDRTITRFVPKVREALAENSTLLPFAPQPGMNAAELLSLATTRLSAGKPDEALICLCHAAVGQESHDLWTMRATFARLMRNVPAANRFLHQATRFGESLHMYAEMAELAFAGNDASRASDAVHLFRAAMDRSGVTEGDWADKLRRFTERLAE